MKASVTKICQPHRFSCRSPSVVACTSLVTQSEKMNRGGHQDIKRCPGAACFYACTQHSAPHNGKLKGNIGLFYLSFITTYETNVRIVTGYGHCNFIQFPMFCSHDFRHKSNCAIVINIWLIYFFNTIMLDVLIYCIDTLLL